MWFKVGVQFVNPNGYVGDKVYNFIASAEALNFLSDKSARDTFVISSHGFTYKNSVIFTSIDEASVDDIQMYKEITNITVHPSVCLGLYSKEDSAKFLMRNSALFERFIENYCLVTCENIEKKRITFAVPFNKFSCHKIYTNDFIYIVKVNAGSLEDKKLQVVKFQKSIGCRNYTIVTDYKRISYSEYISQINTSTSTSTSDSVSTHSTSWNPEYTAIFTNTNSSFLDECKDKVNSYLDYDNTVFNTKSTTNTTTEKEFNNMKKIFGTYFGKFDTTSIAMSIYGMAVKDTTGRHVTYKDGEIMDVSEFIIPNMNYFFAMPTAINAIRVNDIILHQDKPMMCIKGNEDGSIRAIDFTTQEIKDIMPKKNPFGFNFVTKVVCPFGENSFMMEGFGADSSNPFGNMLPMMMLMDGKSGAKDNSDMLMMAMMMGNGGDFTSNPMLMYMMMKDGGADFDPMMLMLMMQNKGAECKCKCKENSQDE